MSPLIKPSLGIYIHWPYCLSKCPYCDFASYACPQINEETLFEGYKRDFLQFLSFIKNRQISSIFFGGGTPSLMSPNLIERLLNLFLTELSFQKNTEISLEANPDAITAEKMKDFYNIGINRLSVGVQALNEEDLHFLGRRHTLKTAIQRIQEAASIFERINMDLIYARPKQTLSQWEKELELALSFKLSHYSLYQLTIEEGTPFFNREISTPSEQHAARLYQLTDNIMNTAQIPAYEISNYAKKGFECQHNLIYWQTNDYLGIGPAAHGRIGLTATQNSKSVTEWLQKGPSWETLTPEEKKTEKILMGLRLTQQGFPIEIVNPSGVQKALQKKWITLKDNQIFTTMKGRLMLNQLILLLC